VLKIELLDATHDRAGFDCGTEPLNRYFQQIARQHVAKGISKTYVMVEEFSTSPKAVLGFFTLSLCQVLGQEVPARWLKKLPGQIPAMKLGRLAVAKQKHGHGFGKSLLVEALFKVVQVADIAGGIGLFVDAKDEKAVAFYGRFGFEPTSTGSLTLFMPMETIKQFVAVI